MAMERSTILVVDDEPALRRGVAHCMEIAGFEAVTAADGYEALHMVAERRPALVILDVMMAGMSGLEVCRRLRADPETRDMKIVFLSARGQLREQAEGLEAGADCYITKPFEIMDLMNTVKRLLEPQP